LKLSWVCVCGKEHDSVREAEDCCGNYVVETPDEEEIEE